MVQQDVALADGVKHVGTVGHLPDRCRHVRRVFQHRFVDHVGHLQQAHQVHRPFDAVAVRVGQAELLQQSHHQRGRRVVCDFQAHCVAEVARRQFTLQRFAQVRDFIFRHKQVGVARHAELVAAMYVDLREQLMHKALHERRQQHEPIRVARQFRRHLHKPGQGTRGLHDGQFSLTAECILARQLDDEVQALVEHAWERVRWVKSHRGQDGHQLALEETPTPSALGFIPIGGHVEEDAFLLQQRQDLLLQHGILLRDQLPHPLRDHAKCLLHRQPVGRDRRRVVAHLLLQSGNADFKELIEIARDDADEFQPLHQRHTRVGGLGEHTGIELQDAQFAIEQIARGQCRHVVFRRMTIRPLFHSSMSDL